MEHDADASLEKALEPKKKRRKRRGLPASKIPKPPREETFMETLARRVEFRAAWIKRNGDQEELCPACGKTHLIRYQLPGGGCFKPLPKPPPPPPPPPPRPVPERTAKRRARPVGSKARKDSLGYIPKRYSIRLPRGPF
jgi:hypothetical protein